MSVQQEVPSEAMSIRACGETRVHAWLQDDWLRKVCPSIQERMARYSQKEIRFNLLALVRNRAEALQEQLDSLGSQSAMDTDSGPASTSNAAAPDDDIGAVRQM